LLCWFHHRLVHEGGWRVSWLWDDTPAFEDPRGSLHSARSRRRPRVRASADELVAANRARGVDPDGWTASARWEREADIPDEALFAALEAGLR
ncbi:MAG: hypothetical protein R3195_13290, partial [Gemmatimonadota bacterium]|nr:hypothetical protein [Gemmatimonadota bacterium]